MPFVRTGLAALLLVVCAANVSQSLESTADQYKAQEEVPHSSQLLSKATNHSVNVRQFLKIKPVDGNQNNKKSDVHDKLQSPSAKLKIQSQEALNKGTDQRHRRHIDFAGSYRLNSYYSTWNPAAATVIAIPPLESFSIYQPPFYQLRRPYYIPVWGAPGKIPLYFPPQPVYVNAGYPVHNPPNKGSLPPSGYLPPDPNTVTPPPSNETDNTTLMPVGPKFNPDDPDMNLVWGNVSNNRPSKPTPTRAPGGQASTHPPLIHNTESPRVPTTVRPPSSGSGFRPPVNNNQPRPSGGRQPSRCVWAIISCCSTGSAEVSYSCFEQLGCIGAFWDSSPCESDFARAAIANVINYYQAK